jgi:spore coat polysaccharide biosynthesis predicted glycosyltransferase SpsG
VSKIVAFCCDGGRTRGVGHVMRCLSLAEEFAARGFQPVFAADLGGVGWVIDELRRRNITVVTSAHVDIGEIISMAPTAAVVDSYDLPHAESDKIRAAGIPMLAIHDGDNGDRPADLHLDQNLGAHGPGLNGLRYALLRDDIVRLRPAQPRSGTTRTPPTVLAFFGGTDAFGAAPLVAEALAATGLAFRATIVAASDEYAARIRAIEPGADQSFTVIPAGGELTEHIADADLVISASGTTLWELLCVGAASAVVCVVDNQEIGYARVIATGVAAGLGGLTTMRTDLAPARDALRALLLDPAERDRLRAAGWHLVDGQGRRRVADALLARV